MATALHLFTHYYCIRKWPGNLVLIIFYISHNLTFDSFNTEVDEHKIFCMDSYAKFKHLLILK